jgi:hypothetical protein
MSYQTADREIAARVATILVELGCTAFMAHEHVEVSEEWQERILQELGQCALFVPILSTNYYNSIWCKQESGIAAFRKITLIPLSTDGSIPLGFISNIQSIKINPDRPTYTDVLHGMVKQDSLFTINKLIDLVAGSKSFRAAEANFELIAPFLSRAYRRQIVDLLHVSTDNKQVCHASLCATKYLPPLVSSHGKYMDSEKRKELDGVLAQYSKVKTKT